VEEKKEKLLGNRLGLPSQFVRAIETIRGQYSKGECDFSATELLTPPRVRQLRKKHGHEVTEDVADQLFSFYGSLNHFILEGNVQEGIAEKRYYAQYGDHTVSGAIDYQANEIITDYKFVSFSKAMYGDFDEYTKQLNIYGDILRKNGKKPKGLQVILIFRDWKKVTENNKGKWPFNNAKYPKEPAMIVPLKIKKHPITEDFILKRIAMHVEAEKSLPVCTKEETWYRSGYAHRCEDYCEVSKFCTQFGGESKEIE
jgi:hypothetical protein